MPRLKKAKASVSTTNITPKRKYTRRQGFSKAGSSGGDADAQLAAITALIGVSVIGGKQRLEMIRKIVV